MKILEEDFLGDTPFLAVDLDILEDNINRLAKLAKEAGVKLRPHTKTHKSPYIAQLQIKAGASGITVAKLGEAEVMAAHGIKDILIAFPIVGKKKLKRFQSLLNQADLSVGLDDIRVARDIDEVGEFTKRRIPIYIDVDTGLHRMGRTPEESVSHILEISKLKHIEIRGLMSHTGHAYDCGSEKERLEIAIRDAEMMYWTKEQLANEGVEVPEISVGATATARLIKDIPFVTEMRPGMYVFNDRFVLSASGATKEQCAALVVATVVSHPSSERLILDAGSKTLALDKAWLVNHGYILGHENLNLIALSEEHGTVEVQGTTNLRIGDVVQIIPNHICPVVNLADTMYGFRDGKLERTIEVAGRGKNR